MISSSIKTFEKLVNVVLFVNFIILLYNSFFRFTLNQVMDYIFRSILKKQYPGKLNVDHFFM